MGSFVPNIPPNLLNLIQSNSLSRMVRESLGVSAAFMSDATPEPLPQGVGASIMMATLGRIATDQRPAPAIGATPRATFSTETYTATPQPYAVSIEIDAPSLYIQTAGNRMQQSVSRIGDWAGRTGSRLARAKLYTHCAGQSVIRRAQTTSDSVLLVTSLAGFRFSYVAGNPIPVSSTTPLPITIVAGTTFTALVTGVTPLDPDFPDGPGQLTLAVALSAAVVANSFTYVTDARPKVQRPGGKVSSEALVAGDIPTLKDVIAMKARLRGRGVEPHANTRTYHLHVDEWFFALITEDPKWTSAFSTAGLSPIIGANAVWSPSLGITIIENNDSPAIGKGAVVQVGSSAATSVGATGTPGASQTFLENGIDVVNSTGVSVRYAIMTGAEVMKKVFVKENEYLELLGGNTIHVINNEWRSVNINGINFVEGQVENWRMLWRPPLDERALVTTVTVSSTFDLALPTDRDAISDTVDKSPLKRAVVLQYGAPPY